MSSANNTHKLIAPLVLDLDAGQMHQKFWEVGNDGIQFQVSPSVGIIDLAVYTSNRPEDKRIPLGSYTVASGQTEVLSFTTLGIVHMDIVARTASSVVIVPRLATAEGVRQGIGEYLPDPTALTGPEQREQYTQLSCDLQDIKKELKKLNMYFALITNTKL